MSHQPLLFTPGPLSTSVTVKEAMLKDMGSRDHAFINAVNTFKKSKLKRVPFMILLGLELKPSIFHPLTLKP